MADSKSTDVVVIGAGMGGLAAALSLSARGLQVTVLEAGPRVGGKVDVHIHEDVEMDTGPSVLTLPHVLSQILQQAGTSLEKEFALVEAEPAFRYRFPDGTLFDVFPRWEDTIVSAERAFGKPAARQLDSFMDYARGIWDASKDTFVLGKAPKGRDLPMLFAKNPLSLMRVDPFRSMWDAISDKVKEPRAQDVLLRYATYNGSSPYLAPATLNCIAHVEMGLGMFGVKGGMHEIARVLRRLAEEKGCVFRLCSPVKKIVVEKKRVCAVVLQDDERLDTTEVVVNADVAHLTETLLPESRRALPKPGTASLSGHCMLVKARRRPERVAHEVLFPETYKKEFDDLFDGQRPPRQPTLYLCAQEKAHLRSGWKDHEPVFVMANAPPTGLRSGEDEESLARELSQTMRSLLVKNRLIDEQDEIVWERSPRQLADRFLGSRGSIYGAASHGWNAAFQRPRNRVDGIRGLYLASGTAHPGGGVPLCLQSGRMAAELCAADRVR